MREVAAARINTLLHRPPESPLPSPPAQLRKPEPLPESAALRSLALSQRPDLQALTDRLRADEAAIALAEKEFRPDFELTAAYDTIMGNGPTRDLAPQVGLRINVPVREARRCAALAEARARLAQRRATLDKQIDEAGFQIQEGEAKVRESERALRLYDETTLPAAEANVRAAQSAYVTGKASFLTLIDAQRELINVRDRRYEAIAELFRRRAALERSIGGPLPSGALTK
jgi:outer membrane protein TolC